LRHSSGKRGLRIAARYGWLTYTYCVIGISRYVVAVGLLATLGIATEAEEPNSSLIRLTAVVTNARGEALSGLRAADFEITVDGAPRPIEAFEFKNGRSPVPRVVAFLLDEFHVDSSSSVAVRDRLLSVVDSHLRAGDLVIVFKPLDSLTKIEPTDNRDVIRQSIETFEGRKGDYTPRTTFEQKYMAQAPNAVVAARAQIVSSALRALALRLGELPDGRAAIVLVSDGFARQRVERSVPANLLSAVRVANRGDVPVYVFAPSPAAPSPEGGSDDPAVVALRAVAEQTGGAYHAGVASFPDGMTRLFRELDSHYVLSYHSPHGDDGRFHAVQITLKRPDALVRARAGYVAPLAIDLRAASMPSATPARALRRSPLIQSWSGFTKAADGGARLTLTWQPAPLRAGALLPVPALLALTAKTAKGTVLFDGSVPAVGGTPREDTRAQATFVAPPGRVLIDIKILDDKGVVLDTDSRDVEVPNLIGPRPTILPPAVLRITTAREYRAAFDDPEVPPLPTREFRRTERLLLRVPAYEANGAPARVGATLLNRWRQPMRALLPMDEPSGDGVTQFDLPLAPLPPGEYTVRFTVGSAAEQVTFKVTG
jgi:VWFA-related protein